MARDLPDGPVVKTLVSTAGGTGSIPGQETKISHSNVAWAKKKKKVRSIGFGIKNEFAKCYHCQVSVVRVIVFTVFT